MCVQFSRGSQLALVVKNPPANAWVLRAWVWSLGQEGPLEEGMATHASILAWRTPIDRRVWWAAVHKAVKSQTWLKRLSTESSFLRNSLQFSSHSQRHSKIAKMLRMLAFIVTNKNGNLKMLFIDNCHLLIWSKTVV